MGLIGRFYHIKKNVLLGVCDRFGFSNNLLLCGVVVVDVFIVSGGGFASIMECIMRTHLNNTFE